jgi:hypothetical protein
LIIFAFNKFCSEQDKDFSFSPLLLDLFEALSGLKTLSSPHPFQISALRGGPYLLAYRSNIYDTLKSSKKSFKILLETLFSNQPSTFDYSLPEDCLTLAIVNASRHQQRLLLKKSHCSISVLRKWADTLTELTDLLRLIVWTEKSLQSKDLRKEMDIRGIFNKISSTKYSRISIRSL